MAGVITAIEIQQKRKERVNVYLDDAYAFSLSAIVAERAQLSVGSFLGDQDIEKLAGDDRYQKALDSALSFLSYRPRTEKEVRTNLAKKRVEPDTIEKVVARLAELRLLDDKAFAQFWRENRQRCSPRGLRAIKAELRSKGIDGEVIEEVLEDSVDEESEAYRAAQRKIRTLRGLDYPTFRQRLGSYLLRRGFSYDTVGTLTRRLWREVDAAESENRDNSGGTLDE